MFLGMGNNKEPKGDRRSQLEERTRVAVPMDLITNCIYYLVWQKNHPF